MGWTVERDLYWLNSPPFAALYTLLLVVIVAVTVVRAGRLSWRLFGGVPRRRISLDRALDGSVSADALARAALANLVPHETPQERVAQLRARPRVDLEAALRTLRAADNRFDYLWRLQAIGVSSTWSLMRLTFIAAAFITAYGFLPTWMYFYNDANVEGLKVLYPASEWVLARLALGLGVAGGLCLVAMVFDGRLQRRLASWKYLYATARDAWSAEQPR
jgi:hypothetical protein